MFLTLIIDERILESHDSQMLSRLSSWNAPVMYTLHKTKFNNFDNPCLV